MSFPFQTLVVIVCDGTTILIHGLGTSLCKQGPAQYKDRLYWHRGFHYKNDTVARPSHLYNGKTISLYWNGPLISSLVNTAKGFICKYYWHGLMLVNADEFSLYKCGELLQTDWLPLHKEASSCGVVPPLFSSPRALQGLWLCSATQGPLGCWVSAGIYGFRPATMCIRKSSVVFILYLPLSVTQTLPNYNFLTKRTNHLSSLNGS